MPDTYARVAERGERSGTQSQARLQDLLRSEREFCGPDHCRAERSLMTA